MSAYRIATCLVLAATLCAIGGRAQPYPVVDTGQRTFYDVSAEISPPAPGSAFDGQDAGHDGHQPEYRDNHDGTVTDLVTGLMWQQSPDRTGDGLVTAEDKLSYQDAVAAAATCTTGGYDDWRLPSIKELYSLILFTGRDPSGYTGTSTDGLIPFIDTVFAFGYGDTQAGERIIDAQFASATLSVAPIMVGEEGMFGVNFADGRIKGYPTGPMPGQTEPKKFYVLYVRGNPAYGINDFKDNGDGTVSDEATGLMWAQRDNGEAVNWQEALAWVRQCNATAYLGYTDWRLPDVKELQSIVDYARSPSTTSSATIDPLFDCSTIVDEGGQENYPFYWSSTTHASLAGGQSAAYVAFGEALGWMRDPFGNYQLMDVHGAGSQRSDPKAGDPSRYPYGFGPQGDVIRIYNYVRPVRDLISNGVGERGELPRGAELYQNYPNPFNPVTTIAFRLDRAGHTAVRVFNLLGEEIDTPLEASLPGGYHTVAWDARAEPSGRYFYRLELSGTVVATRSMTLLR